MVVKGGALLVKVVITGVQHIVRSRTDGVALTTVPKIIAELCADLIFWAMSAIE